MCNGTSNQDKKQQSKTVMMGSIQFLRLPLENIRQEIVVPVATPRRDINEPRTLEWPRLGEHLPVASEDRDFFAHSLPDLVKGGNRIAQNAN